VVFDWVVLTDRGKVKFNSEAIKVNKEVVRSLGESFLGTEDSLGSNFSTLGVVIGTSLVTLSKLQSRMEA